MYRRAEGQGDVEVWTGTGAFEVALWIAVWVFC